MSRILESIRPVIQKAKHVKINYPRLREFCSGFGGLETSFVSPFKAQKLSPDDKLQLDFAYNAANFCYWGDPQWTVDYQGNQIHGAFGMKAAFNRALEEGFPLLNPLYLQSLTEKDFAQITRGSGTLPLFRERVDFLRQFGSTLMNRYESKAVNVVEAARGDALKLVDELTSNFPCYDDSADYEGDRVLFHKRAQLVTHNAHKLLQDSTGIGLRRTDRLTALADYKVPQILRTLGILEYSQELVGKVDGMMPLLAGSLEEVEIRAFTLEACQRMAQLLPGIEVIDLDHWLYKKSKEPAIRDASKPYHRTLTTAY